MNSIKKVILKIIPYQVVRYLTSFLFDKEKFKLKQSDTVFKEIYETNLWSSEESKSGEGSTLEATVNIRKEIPEIISKYQIKTMLDIPCGDYNWMKTVVKNCDYIGADIVEGIITENNKRFANEKVKFMVADLTKDKLPKVDLVFSKDCLQHLSNENVKKAINNIIDSGSKYLLTTSYPQTWRNYDIYDGDYRSLNLLIKPFNFPKPLMKVEERSKIKTVEPDKTMYLYEISTLKKF